MEIIEAEFENGVLRPIHRLALRPGERVGILVVRRPDPTRWDLDRLSKGAAADDESLAKGGLGDRTGSRGPAMIRSLTDVEVGEIELATDEALGRLEPQG